MRLSCHVLPSGRRGDSFDDHYRDRRDPRDPRDSRDRYDSRSSSSSSSRHDRDRDRGRGGRSRSRDRGGRSRSRSRDRGSSRSSSGRDRSRSRERDPYYGSRYVDSLQSLPDDISIVLMMACCAMHLLSNLLSSGAAPYDPYFDRRQAPYDPYAAAMMAAMAAAYRPPIAPAGLSSRFVTLLGVLTSH